MATIQIISLANGGSTPYDGEYVREYDPARNGIDKHGYLMTAHLVTTPNRDEAMQFAHARDALDCWRQTDPRQPKRPDGRPNRPLTSFTVEIS